MKAIRLSMILSILIFSTALLVGQKNLKSDSRTTPAKTDCLKSSSDFWSGVLANVCESRDDCMNAINKTWKAHYINRTSARPEGCTSSCEEGMSKVKAHVIKQKWNNRSELAQAICRAQRKYAKQYPNCVSVSESVCNFVDTSSKARSK